VKLLALAFLILIGATLVAESLHFETPKKYIYFAMAFAAAVELINLRVRSLMQNRRPP
jgi:predicted tellurium resistance membrane protein TerC